MCIQATLSIFLTLSSFSRTLVQKSVLHVRGFVIFNPSYFLLAHLHLQEMWGKKATTVCPCTAQMCCFIQVWRAVLPRSCWSLQKRLVRYSLIVLSLWDCNWYTLSLSSMIHSKFLLTITSTDLSALSSDVTQTCIHERSEFWILDGCTFLSLRLLHMSVYSCS